ncbi:RNA methyltransferase [Benzoatithermus flavus]|uniref:TrmH family RNA methyltransferase n=1 Tax=Benzoatithermus flavus TaxID=3108223 RepID=A0ABU8XKA4_9PROT
MKLEGKRRGDVEALPPGPVVILCRTQMGENIGSAARAMLNFGLTELRLVAPQCGWPNAKAVAAASGAVEILNRLEIYPDLVAATADLHHTFATTARPRELKKPVVDGEAAAAEALQLVTEGRRVGLVFGPERTGLTNDELLLADALVSFPVNPAFASLNLAQAVLLMGYAWFRRAHAADHPVPAPAAAPAAEVPPATKAEVAGLLEHLVRELDAVDFFRTDQRRASLIRAISVMIERRGWTTPEIHLMRGIIKDLVGGRRARQKGPATPS